MTKRSEAARVPTRKVQVVLDIEDARRARRQRRLGIALMVILYAEVALYYALRCGLLD